MSNKPNQVTKVKEPLVRVTKRDIIPTWQKWAVRLMAILLSLVVVTIFVFSLTGIGPGETFGLMREGVFSNMYYRKGTILFTEKLLCIAVALAPGFKMKFWNIGAEGQVLMGALSTAIVMVNFSTLSTPLLFTIMIVSSVVMGAIWGLIPAIFKAKWNVNETLFTLMMNYVAMQLVDYYYNIWKGSKASLGMLNPGTKAGYLPEYNGSSNNIIVTVVLIITVLMYIYLKKTKHGYEIAVVGESENTARYAGIDVKKVIIRTMLISGAVCGICGFLTVSGQDHSIASDSTAGGYGFTAIIVAWLAKFNTAIMIAIALLIVFLEKGTAHIADTFVGFDANASKIVIGIVLFFIIGSEFFINYKLNFPKKESKEA